MESCFYLLRALTHVHAGAEGTNAGIVDNLVQRDPVTGIPVVHASSIKGSLKELFEEKIYPNQLNINTIEFIFGKTDTDKGNRTPNYYFFQADLLSIPVRSNMQPYFNATSPETLKNFLSQAVSFSNKQLESWKKWLEPLINSNPVLGQPKCINRANVQELKIDDYNYKPQAFPVPNNDTGYSTLLGKDVVLFHHDDFKFICSRLPVVARNKLKNRESINLWYEEIVPRESRFWFQVSKPEKDNSLDAGLTQHKNLVQIGGNASIGYGFCSLTNLNA